MTASCSTYDAVYKILLIGDANAGKSSVLLQFVDGIFSSSHIISLGVDFKIKTLVCDDDRCIKLQIWDTKGQEEWHMINATYFSAVHAIVVVFDLTERASFERVEHWLSEIKKYASDDVMVCLLGNKIDLIDDRKISREEAVRFSKLHCLCYQEISAKNACEVSEVFYRLCGLLMEQT